MAVNHCGEVNPITWLGENWTNMIDTVMTLASNVGHEAEENTTGTISKAEARDALRKHKGNIWASVTECVEGRQQKVVILMTMLVVTIMSMRLVVIIIGFMNKEDMLIVPTVSSISRQYLTMTSLQ